MSDDGIEKLAEAVRENTAALRLLARANPKVYDERSDLLAKGLGVCSRTAYELKKRRGKKTTRVESPARRAARLKGIAVAQARRRANAM